VACLFVIAVKYMKLWLIVVFSALFNCVAIAQDNSSCATALSPPIFKARDHQPTLSREDAAALGERIVLKLQMASIHARHGEFAKAFAEIDDGVYLNGSGWELIPFHKRFVVNYTPATYEDLVDKLDTLFYTSGKLPPMLHFQKNLVVSWVVLPDADASAEVWKIVWTDRILELTEELGHLAQYMLEYGSSRWNISQYFNDPKNVERVKVVIGAYSDHPMSRTDFVEADVYAFMLETFGPEFVPKAYGIKNFWETRQFPDDFYRRRLKNAVSIGN